MTYFDKKTAKYLLDQLTEDEEVMIDADDLMEALSDIIYLHYHIEDLKSDIRARDQHIEEILEYYEGG
ncbi:MAG: hypothetical protein PHW63_09725 [Alphaproteobacteria bacterium]|nr:hypothetical protein [Alphaproteobacteria bacterium]